MTLTFKTQKEDNSLFTEKLYSIYRSVLKELINTDKTEWVKYVNEELKHVIQSLVFFYDDAGIRSYCNLLSGAMIFCIDNKKDNTESYNILFKSFCEFSLLISKNSGSFNKVKMYYSFLFIELNNDYNKALSFYERVLDLSFHNSDKPVLLEFKMYCISELMRKSISDDSQHKVLLNKHIDVLISVISTKEKYQGYLMFPDFKGLVEKYKYNRDEFIYIKDKMFELVNNCIIKDNLPMFYTLLNIYNEVLLNTEQNQKYIQEELIDIYITLIFRTRALVNKQYLEITFHFFENAIKELDSKRLISSSLGEYIITKISQVAQNSNEDNHIVVLKSVDLLYSFFNKKEKLTFVANNAEKKKLLYRAMFNIGTDCIENNYEAGLRSVSNALGWFIINSIEQGTVDLTSYLIERASELYKISKDMEISSKTLIFMLTLFTTVGTFCFKNVLYNRYLSKDLKEICFEDVEKIKTAISLRTSENNTWNQLFDNYTIDYSKKFLDEFEKSKAKNKS